MKVLINDTWGEDLHPKIERQYPFAKTSVVGGKRILRNPHGHMVAECFLRSFRRAYLETNGKEPDSVEIDFFPFLEYQKDPLGWARRASEKKYDLIINSWGQVVNDLWTRAFDKMRFLQSDEFAEMKALVGDTIMFFASGNSDNSKRGKPDAQNDLNFLQYCLKTEMETVFTVGSCDSEGVPSIFSSDGWVDVAGRGEQVYVWDPLQGKQVSVDGTSFANPDIAGHVFGLGHRGVKEIRAYFKKRATTHPAWPENVLHPKVGEGIIIHCEPNLSMETSYHDESKL